jgi:hypothetical protein
MNNIGITNIWDMHPQSLINNGMAWRLEGSIGRECMRLIESGHAILGDKAHTDYWGNTVPGRDWVIPGTKGSVAYGNAMRLRRGEEPLTEEEWDAGLGYDPDGDM